MIGPMTSIADRRRVSTQARARPALAVFALVNGVVALLGAIGLATGVLSLGEGVERRLPLQSPAFAGLALAIVVAAPLTMLGWCAWRGDERTDQETMLAGLLLIGWIAVQVAFIRTFSWFQPAYVLIGAAMVALADRRLRTG